MSDNGGQWLGGRRSSGIAAIAVVALIIVAGVLWWQSRSSNETSGQPSTATAQPVQTSDGGVSPVAPVGGDQSVPTSAPKDVTWQVWHSMVLPFSRSAGPARTQGQAVTGFAHTPDGALLAAAQAAGRRAAATDPGWRDVSDKMIAPGPGRDAWVAARSKVNLTQEPAPGTFAQLAGFQFLSYDLAQAVIQLVSRSSTDGALAVTPEHMVWQDGDWRLQLAADGGEATSKQQITSLAGFIAWGGA